MLICTNILSFAVLLNNGSSLFIQIKSTVSPGQYDAKCSWWIKQKACRIAELVSMNWSIVCNMWDHLSYVSHSLNSIKGSFRKYAHSKSPLFSKLTPGHFTHEYSLIIPTHYLSKGVHFFFYFLLFLLLLHQQFWKCHYVL